MEWALVVGLDEGRSDRNDGPGNEPNPNESEKAGDRRYLDSKEEDRESVDGDGQRPESTADVADLVEDRLRCARCPWPHNAFHHPLDAHETTYRLREVTCQEA